MALTKKLLNNRITPSQLVLQGNQPDGTLTQYYMDDADGIGSQINPPAATAVQFVVPAGMPNLASVKEYLKSFALIIGGFNFNSSVAAQTSNNLQIVESAIDGNQAVQTIFSALTVSNMQQNPNLLNVNAPFIITNTSSLKISASGAALTPVVYTLTMRIIGAIPYGKLDEFAASAVIAVGPETCSCVAA